MNDVIFSRFADFRRGKDSEKYKPHKPLLVLMALKMLQVNGTSAIQWKVAKPKLEELIREFNNVDSVKPQEPFYRLTKDASKFGGLWHVDTALNDTNYASKLNSENPIGRFPQDLEQQLLSESQLANQIIRQIVEMQFEEEDYDRVLHAIGFSRDDIFNAEATSVLVDFENDLEKRRKSTWPKQILEIWDFSCAFCGYGGFLDKDAVGLDAAHIRSFKKDGPDEPDNGLALCVLHHRLFDRGVIGLTDNLSISISRRFRPVAEYEDHFARLVDKVIRPAGMIETNLLHVRWHRDTIFKH